MVKHRANICAFFSVYFNRLWGVFLLQRGGYQALKWNKSSFIIAFAFQYFVGATWFIWEKKKNQKERICCVVSYSKSILCLLHDLFFALSNATTQRTNRNYTQTVRMDSFYRKYVTSIRHFYFVFRFFISLRFVRHGMKILFLLPQSWNVCHH